MAPALGIDFGTSNTVIAMWNEEKEEAVPLEIPGISRSLVYHSGETSGEHASIIPSLIYYGRSKERWLGMQVLDRHLGHSSRTFRWMKQYIARRSPIRISIDASPVTFQDAGQAFLTSLLMTATPDLASKDREFAFTVPVEAFEHYQEWLEDVAGSIGIADLLLIDEATAAALGYGARVREGDVYMVFDFGGGTLDVAVVLVEDYGANEVDRRCRVLGKSGADIGGATIDGWLFEELLRRNDKSDADEEVRKHSRALLLECERAKEELSVRDLAVIGFEATDGSLKLKGQLSRQDLDDLLDRHDAFTLMDRTIRRAINTARERGYGEDAIRSVLMVGGSSLVPAVQKLVQRIFGRERVLLHRPLDAVARGAAAFAAGVGLADHIQHDYAIRYVDPQQSQYAYRVLVKRGTLYPTDEPVARMRVKASHDGQTDLGIAIFEMADRSQRKSNPVEIVFDREGAARIRRVSAEEEDQRGAFWVNERSPTFLHLASPARKGEAHFDVEFGIDDHKRLTISARQLGSNHLVLRDAPLIKLR